MGFCAVLIMKYHFTTENSGKFQRLSYLDILNWKVVAQTDNPPFGNRPAKMYESATGKLAWFHYEKEPQEPEEKIERFDWMSISSDKAGHPLLASCSHYFKRTQDIDSFNQAFAFMNNIDLDTDRRANEAFKAFCND